MSIKVFFYPNGELYLAKDATGLTSANANFWDPAQHGNMDPPGVKFGGASIYAGSAGFLVEVGGVVPDRWFSTGDVTKSGFSATIRPNGKIREALLNGWLRREDDHGGELQPPIGNLKSTIEMIAGPHEAVVDEDIQSIISRSLSFSAENYLALRVAMEARLIPDIALTFVPCCWIKIANKWYCLTC